jgi:hemin uptake protein HemP
MSGDDDKDESGPRTAPPPHAGSTIRHRVSDLMQGGRQAILEHEGADYLLRITASGRLILTK